MNTLTDGFLAGYISAIIAMTFSMILAVHLQVNYVDKYKPVAPIILKCPDSTKQIIIPDASKMEL